MSVTIYSPPDAIPLARQTRVAFKDWALVCEALGRGRQSVIIRKGGLAEGKAGFEFRHPEFWLFPTQYHEQAAKVRPEELTQLQRVTAPTPLAHDVGGMVRVRSLFRLEWARRIEDWTQVSELVPFHVYREEVARERFAYSDRHHEAGSLMVAFGRIFSIAGTDGWTFPDSPDFGGCKSWIELPEPPTDFPLQAVVGDKEHAARAAALGEIFGVQ